MNEESQVNLDNVQEQEMPSIDISKYVGEKVKIELVEEHKGKIFDNVQSYYVLLKTNVINPEEKDPFLQIRASKLLGLNTRMKDGKEVVFWGGNSKMAKYLKKMDVAHYKDLKEKEVQLKPTEPNDEGKEFITF